LAKAFLQNLVEKYVWDFSKKSISGEFDLKGTEAWARLIGYKDNFSEEAVSEQRALGLSTVYTTDHPVYYPLAHQPNSYMSSANMFLTSMIHADSWGNSYIGINRNGRGEVRSLDILQPWECESINVIDGNAYYNINGMIYPSSGLSFKGCASFPLVFNGWTKWSQPYPAERYDYGQGFKSREICCYGIGSKASWNIVIRRQYDS